MFGDIGGMIPEIAWENVRWINENIFDRWEHFGGKMIAVDPFRQYFLLTWIKRLKPNNASKALHKELRRWAEVARREPLFIPEYFIEPGKKSSSKKPSSNKPPKKTLIRCVPRFDGEYNELFWLIIRSYCNLYSLATHRKTIEELALGAYAYCDKKKKHTEEFDKKALADFRRLLNLSNVFLLARWVHDMIERAISNRDEALFKIVSNSLGRDVSLESSEPAREWLLITLLWHLGGKDIRPRREFLHLLLAKGIVTAGMDETSFRSQLSTLGLTDI